MKIYVIRHGETDYNVRRLFQGQINTDLNDTGRAQARAAAEKIRAMGLTFDRVYSSPLQRAVETVEIITGKDSSEIQTDDRLLEMNFGALEGQPFDRDSRACGSLFQDPPSYRPVPGSESFPEVIDRIGSFFTELAKERPGESVLVGCHGCAMRTLLVFLSYLDLKDIWKQEIGNCAVIQLGFYEGTDGAGALRVDRIIETQDRNTDLLQIRG